MASTIFHNQLHKLPMTLGCLASPLGAISLSPRRVGSVGHFSSHGPQEWTLVVDGSVLPAEISEELEPQKERPRSETSPDHYMLHNLHSIL